MGYFFDEISHAPLCNTRSICDQEAWYCHALPQPTLNGSQADGAYPDGDVNAWIVLFLLLQPLIYLLSRELVL